VIKALKAAMNFSDHSTHEYIASHNNLRVASDAKCTSPTQTISRMQAVFVSIMSSAIRNKCCHKGYESAFEHSDMALTQTVLTKHWLYTS
jgi:hypothetical protein